MNFYELICHIGTFLGSVIIYVVSNDVHFSIGLICLCSSLIMQVDNVRGKREGSFMEPW
jgi:hypothetical protein